MCDATAQITRESRVKSRKGTNLIDALIVVLAGVLLAATTFAAIEYYRQLRRAQREYEKARDSVEDIVLSFNRELKREAIG